MLHLRALQLAAWLTPVLPAPIGYALAYLVGTGYWMLNRRARLQVVGNLRVVRPNANRPWLQWAALRVFASATLNHYDLLRVQLVDGSAFLDRVEIRGREHLDAALAAGKGAVLFSAHLGNYGVVAQVPADFGWRTAVVAERIEPPQLFQYMCELRTTLGVQALPPGREAVGPILKLLRENGVLLVTTDREVGGRGHFVPLFGRYASLPSGPALLALRAGASLLPVYTLRTSARHSVFVIRPVLPIGRTGRVAQNVEEAMTMVARELELMIGIDPGQWTVLQDVWQRPKNLNQVGKIQKETDRRDRSCHRQEPAEISLESKIW